MAAPTAFGSGLRSLFQMEPDTLHLNHGSYGAIPKAVTEAQRRWQDRMEAEPSRFVEFEFRPAIRAAAKRLAPYLAADPNHIALVENPTQAVNGVLRSLALGPGDRVLVHDQTYGAVRNAARFVCQTTGADLVEWSLPYPARAPEDATAALAAALDPAPRIAILDHVTSKTALLLPVAEMTRLVKESGALALVDAAHAPGMTPVDVGAIGADWLVGACHKWMFAARGCAFLWAADPERPPLHPAVVSHGFEQGFLAEFDWVGTRDGSAHHSLPTALDFLDRFGAETVRTHNHALVHAAALKMADAFGTEVGAPAALTGSMATVRLPEGYGLSEDAALALRHRLLWEDRIQTRVNAQAGGLWVRLSAQIYNEAEEFDRLAEAILAKRPNV